MSLSLVLIVILVACLIASLLNRFFGRGDDEPETDRFFEKYGHERHCNMVHMSTLNTDDDYCDCKASGRSSMKKL
jgi:hypothetical protein